MSRKRWLTVGVPVIVVLLGLAGAAALVLSSPEPGREDEAERVVPVEVETVERSTWPITVHAQGTVTAARRVELRPQVSGEVEWVSPDLVPGGVVGRGEPLLRIDRRDYRLAVESAEAALADAEARLELERGRQRVAEWEWQMLEDELAVEEIRPELARREPQLRAAESAVERARVELDKAELALERTTLHAPFDALVLEERVDRGQLVAPDAPVATLVGTDELWVRLALPAEELPWIRVGPEEGSSVTLTYRQGRADVRRQGRVVRLLGDLDPAGRMVRLLVSVPDPFDLQGGGLRRLPAERAPLLLGSWVEARIDSPIEVEAVALDRDLLAEEGTVWVMGEDDRLEIREVEVVWEEPQTVLVESGLEAGERLVRSRIPTPVEGLRLRVVESQGESENGAEAGSPPASSGSSGSRDG